MKTGRLPARVAAVALACICAGPLAAETGDTPEPPSIPGWDAMISSLRQMPAAALSRLPPEMREDPQVQQEVARLILQAFTLSALGALGGDGDHPAFLPGIGELINVGQPNADTIYRVAQITPGGSYRLRGRRGSLTMAVIGQVGPSPADPGSDGDHPGATRNYLELGELATDADGNFDVLLSPARPPGYEGDWWPLHPKTYRLMLRQVSLDWASEVDPSVAIERVDVPAQRPRPEAAQMEQGLRRIPAATAFMATMFVDHVEALRQEGFVNRLKVLDVSGIGGLEGQFYYEGAYDLADDQALIISAKHPGHCAYRSVLLTNELYQTTDWYNNQSSLNSLQAPVDTDGVLRVVVSARDPGVANWLDTAGYPRGVVQGRWTGCDSQPIPQVEKVALSEVQSKLPADTPRVTAQQRQEILRERRAAYQLRRHW